MPAHVRVQVAIKSCYCDFDINLRALLSQAVIVFTENGLPKERWPPLVRVASVNNRISLSTMREAAYLDGAKPRLEHPVTETAVPVQECAKGKCNCANGTCMDKLLCGPDLSGLPADHPFKNKDPTINYKTMDRVWNEETDRHENIETEHIGIPLHDFMNLCTKETREWFVHDWFAKHQATVEAKMKIEVKDWHGDVLIVSVDFAENLSLRPTKDGFEKQSAYWMYDQVAILPMCITRKWRQGDPEEDRESGIVREWFIVVSNDLNHDNAFFQHAVDKLLIPWFVEKHGEFDGLILWSDGCAKQFKCAHQFLWISHFESRHGGKWVLHCFYGALHDALNHFFRSLPPENLSHFSQPPWQRTT